jgi:hypothetical protein
VSDSLSFKGPTRDKRGGQGAVPQFRSGPTMRALPLFHKSQINLK